MATFSISRLLIFGDLQHPTATEFQICSIDEDERPHRASSPHMSLVSGQRARFVDPEGLPPTPVYVFRGHVAEITALQFIKKDTRFASGHYILIY